MGRILAGARRRGFLSLEAVFGVTLILILVHVWLYRLARLNRQLQMERCASRLAEQAAQCPAPAGSARSLVLLSGRAAADVEWWEGYVRVRVGARDGSGAAERVRPRGGRR